VVKAQVLWGGRGKAGLIKVAANEEELQRHAKDIFERMAPGEKLLLEPCFSAAEEGYIGITVDDLKNKPVIVISRAGGINVEQHAGEDATKPVHRLIDIRRGIRRYELLEMAKSAGYSGAIAGKVAEIAQYLYELFRRYDCDVAEINPVMIAEDGGIIAGDSKVILDEYALVRQPKISQLAAARPNQEDSEVVYVDLGGNIGVVSIGASGTMMVCDSIKVMGGQPANFTDNIGGASSESIRNQCQYILEKSVERGCKAVLISYILVATPLRSIMDGLCAALDAVKMDIPTVAVIRAGGASLQSMSTEEAAKEFEIRGVKMVPTINEAIQRVVAIAAGKGESA
jgi:succinyl-CoA synthetase beta subunit